VNQAAYQQATAGNTKAGEILTYIIPAMSAAASHIEVKNLAKPAHTVGSRKLIV
jgi:hypothetical protein